MRLKEMIFALFLTTGFAIPTLGKNANDKLLTNLADRAEIQDLITAYGTAHDTTDPEVYRQIFTDDVKIFSSNGKLMFDGIGALLVEVKNDRARFNQGAKDGIRTYGVMRNLFTNMDINVTGSTATSHCYSMVIANNAPAKKPEITAMYRYDSEYVKRNGKWRISKMTGNVDWGNDEMAKMLQLGPYTPAEYR